MRCSVFASEPGKAGRAIWLETVWRILACRKTMVWEKLFAKTEPIGTEIASKMLQDVWARDGEKKGRPQWLLRLPREVSPAGRHEEGGKRWRAAAEHRPNRPGSLGKSSVEGGWQRRSLRGRDRSPRNGAFGKRKRRRSHGSGSRWRRER